MAFLTRSRRILFHDSGKDCFLFAASSVFASPVNMVNGGQVTRRAQWASFGRGQNSPCGREIPQQLCRFDQRELLRWGLARGRIVAEHREIHIHIMDCE